MADALAVLTTVHERALRLEAVLTAQKEAAESLEGQIAIAKGRLALRPAIESLLEALAARAHHRSVGHYEQLLSALVRDVLPEGQQQVTLTLETKRDLPALSFEVARPDAEGRLIQSEDILDGNGGSLTNVIVAGLRYIALARSAQRPFIVLDEPDCWLRPDRIPAFAQVIAQLARGQGGAGIQTLLISHHDASLLDTGFVAHLSRTGNNGVAISFPERSAPEFPVDHPGIRRIRLVNCLSHEDTTIPLSPGVTVLTGDNNVGKSAIVTSLRAVAYGESHDGLIRHDCDAMRVEIDLADGERLTWERRRKGSPRTLYRLTNVHGEVLHEGGSGREVPDWVTAKLGIARIDGLDVQIGNQKNPVFLLNEPDTKRAAILSVGRESGLLDAMRRVWKHQMDEDRRTIREGEAQLAQYRARLATGLPALATAQQSLTLLRTLWEQIKASEALIAQGETLSDRLIGAEGLAAQSAACQEAARRLTAVPSLTPTDAGWALADQLARAQAHMVCLRALPETLPTPPVLQDMREAQILADRWEKALADTARLQRVASCRVPETPVLTPTDAGWDLQAAWARRLTEQSLLARLTAVRLPASPELQNSQKILEVGKSLFRQTRQKEALQKVLGVTLPTVPVLQDSAASEKTVLSLERVAQEQARERPALDEVQRQWEQAQQERQALEEELEVCPLCHSRFTHDHAPMADLTNEYEDAETASGRPS